MVWSCACSSHATSAGSTITSTKKTGSQDSAHALAHRGSIGHEAEVPAIAN